MLRRLLLFLQLRFGMKKMHFYFTLVAAAVHVLSWEFAAIPITLFVPYEDKGQIMQSPEQSALDMTEEVKGNENQKAYKSLSKLGSRPPNCEQKCRGCRPCVAVQVPRAEGHTHLGIHYANYEPESWLCKCGSSFFIP